VAAEHGIDAINERLSWLRTNNPAAFHDSKSLRERVFLIEPANGTPCHRFILPASTLSPGESD
jgi:hypothetical protein